MVSVDLAIAIKAPSKNQCFVYDYIRGEIEGLWSLLGAANLVNSVSNDDVNINIDWHNWKDALPGSCKRSYSEEETQAKEPSALYKWAHDEFNREKGIHAYET